MPELPDIVVYLEALEQRALGHELQRLRIAGPFLLRTAQPPIVSMQGRKVTSLRRIGKRIALGFDNGMWLVFHLMIAGRLHWKTKAVAPDGRRTLATFEFDSGTLTLRKLGRRSGLRCIFLRTRMRWQSSIRAGWRCFRLRGMSLPRCSLRKITR